MRRNKWIKSEIPSLEYSLRTGEYVWDRGYDMDEVWYCVASDPEQTELIVFRKNGEYGYEFCIQGGYTSTAGGNDQPLESIKEAMDTCIEHYEAAREYR